MHIYLPTCNYIELYLCVCVWERERGEGGGGGRYVLAYVLESTFHCCAFAFLSTTEDILSIDALCTLPRQL